MKRAALFSVIFLVALRAASAQHSHQNLVVNGDAEQGVQTGTAPNFPQYRVYSTPGWTHQQSAGGEVQTVAENYADGIGDPSGYSDITPGPPDRGNLFFFGGALGQELIYQYIDLSAFAAQIQSGTASYSLSAWLGGSGSQGDYATFAVYFENSSGVGLTNKVIIGPATAAQRNNITEMIHENTLGIIPVGTAKVAVILQTMDVIYPTNNASADDLSFVVNVPSTILPGDFNFDGKVDAADIQPMTTALISPAFYEQDHGLSGPDFNTLSDLNGDGKFTNADLQNLLILLKTGSGSNSVPEPSSLALLALGSLGLLARRRFTTAALFPRSTVLQGRSGMMGG